MVFLKNLFLGIGGVGIAGASGYTVYYFTTPKPEELDLNDFVYDEGNPDDSEEDQEKLKEESEDNLGEQVSGGENSNQGQENPPNSNDSPKSNAENPSAEKSPPKE